MRTTPLVSKSYYNNDEEDETCEETEEVWGEEEDDVATVSVFLFLPQAGLGSIASPLPLGVAMHPLSEKLTVSTCLTW